MRGWILDERHLGDDEYRVLAGVRHEQRQRVLARAHPARTRAAQHRHHLVYGAVTASILASLRAIKTHLVVFDTEVVDLTEVCEDPVDVLFGVQLGGGTDINRAVGYCQELVTTPGKTLLLLARADDGAPELDHALARKVRSIGVPTFACTPTILPELLEAALKGDNLQRFDTPR